MWQRPPLDCITTASDLIPLLIWDCLFIHYQSRLFLFQIFLIHVIGSLSFVVDERR